MPESLLDRAKRLQSEAAAAIQNARELPSGDLGAKMGRFARFMGLDCWSTFMILGGLILVGMAIHPSLLGLLILIIIAAWMMITREVAHHEGAKANAAGKFGVRWAVLAAAGAVMVFAFVMMSHVSWLAL